MMHYDPKELSRNARLLHLATVLFVVLYAVGAALCAFVAASIAVSRGYGVGLGVASFALVMVAYLLIAAVIVAPLRLAVETSLCISRVERHTQQLEILVGTSNDQLMALRELVERSRQRPPA